MKIAIVHDWLTNMGGSERIIRIFHELFPAAPVYTLVYNKKNMPADFKEMDIRTSFIQKMPFGRTKYRTYLPLMPTAIEQFDLSEYDVVLSSSSACAKGVLTGTDTLHICYCNTPMRYAWNMYHYYLPEKKLARIFISLLMNYIRIWDRLAADRVDYFISNSQNVARRIEKYYRRKSEVIYPPVNTDFYTPSAHPGGVDDYYLAVSRLVAYKRVDIAVAAFNQLGLNLKIIGTGPELKSLKKGAKANIEFLGNLSDEEVRGYYRRCKALIFPGKEDFGLTPVEAQSCGRPVIAYAKGGALETVIDGVTGVFFYRQDKEALIEKVDWFVKHSADFDSEHIREHAVKFTETVFKKEILDYVYSKYELFKENNRKMRDSK